VGGSVASVLGGIVGAQVGSIVGASVSGTGGIVGAQVGSIVGASVGGVAQTTLRRDQGPLCLVQVPEIPPTQARLPQ
jgi:outer membrane lipoprotein SlyB